MNGGDLTVESALAAFMSARGVDAMGSGGDCSQAGRRRRRCLRRSRSLSRLRPASLEGVERGPTEAEVREYRRVNDELVEIDEACVALLRAHGHVGERVDDDAPDGPTDPEIFASKTAATQAGLGWIGKTALLVTPEFGSAVASGYGVHGPAAPHGGAGHDRALRLLPGVRRCLPGRRRTGRSVACRPAAERPL